MRGEVNLRQATAAQSIGVGGRTVESFEYSPCPNLPPELAWDGWEEALEEPTAETRANKARAAEPALDAKFEERLAEEKRKAFEAGRERGREEGRRAEREASAPAAAGEAERFRQKAVGLTEEFTRERDRYLHAVEQEVVRLALAVTARILRREAQMDPLLLTGAVRVALGQLAATSEIRIRVPAKDADLWTETIALLPNLAVKPLVVAEEAMRLGDCVIESKVGTVDLGMRAQLSEIERGFFDRAGAASASGPQPAATEVAHAEAGS
jgi:flagellar assembly protein FliH